MSAVTPADLESARQLALTAAQAAGSLLSTWPGEIQVAAKKGTADIVTNLDLAAENLIIERIRAAFPGHHIIAEESGPSEAAVRGGTPGGGASRCTWLVDALDGTSNLAIGLSAYVVGIALCADDLPVLGVVHDPVTQRTWSAVKAGGAWGPDGALLPTARRPAGHGQVLAWTQGYDVPREDATATALKLTMESAARRVLQLWAPLLCWVMLARGDIDGMVGYRAEAVDLPAGALIAAEAGLDVCDLEGRPFDRRIGRRPEDRSFLAARPADIGRLAALVAEARRLAPEVARLPMPARW